MRGATRAWIGAALCIALAPSAAVALIVNVYSAAHNDRFASDYPSSPVANTGGTFIGNGYDWTGVGWCSYAIGANYALLGPRYYLCATHWPVPPGATVQFSPSDGVVKSYTVGAQTALAGDLTVGMFAASIPASDNLHGYPILFLGYDPSRYINQNLLVYGHGNVYWSNGNLIFGPPRIGWNQITQTFTFTGDTATYAYFPSDITTPDRAQFEANDSSSPSFFTTGGQMYLEGAHYATFSNGNLDTLLPVMLDKVNNLMAQTGYLPYVATPTTATWTGGTSSSGRWSDAVNWSSGVVPLDGFSGSQVTSCASVLFDSAKTGKPDIALGANQTVTGIQFKTSAGAPGGFTFTTSAGYTLTIGEAGITNSDNTTQTINCAVALRSPQRWTVNAGNLLVNGAINTGGASPGNLLLVEGAGNAAFTGGVSGSGGLAKDGAGTLTLTGANGYAGDTTIHGGTLLLGATNTASAASKMTVDGGTLDIGPNSNSVGPLMLYSGAIHGTTGTLTASSYSIGGGTISAALGGTAVLNKNSAGTVLLSGANTYTGGTHVYVDPLVFTSASAIPPTGSVTVDAGGYAGAGFAATPANFWNRFNKLATLGVLGLEAGPSGPIDLTGFSDAVRLGSRTAATLDSSNPITPPGTTYRLGGGGGILTINYPLANGAGVRSVEIGTSGGLPGGIVVLGSVSTYTGGTTVNAGTLRCGVDNAIPAYPLTVNGGTLDLSGHSNTVGAFVLAGGSVISGNLLTTAPTFPVQSGSISANLTGSGRAVSKTTTGTVILSGSNTYDGGTNVSGGLLSFGNLSSLPTNGVLTVSAGGYLGAGFSATKANFLDRFNKSSSMGVVGLEANPAGPIDLTGFPDAVRLSSRTAATLDSTNQITPPGTTYRLGGGGGILTVNGALADGTLARAVEIGTSGSLPGGTVVLGAGNSYTGGTTVNAGTVQCGVDNAIPAYPLTVNGGTVDLSSHTNTVGAFTLAGGNVVSGTLLTTAPAFTVQSGTISAILAGTNIGLNKTTSGTVVLSGSNTYTGTTQVTAGVLQANDGQGLPSSSFLSLGGTLQCNSAITFSRPIGTTGHAFAWQSDATGFSARNGKMTVNIANDSHQLGWGSDILGTLHFGSPTANSETELQNPIYLPSGNYTVDVMSGAGGDFATISGLISGFNGSGLTKTGSGLLVLTGNNTYGGTTTINAGTLQVGAGGLAGKVAGNIVNNANLIIDRSNAWSYAFSISGNGATIKRGAGTLTLTGDSGGFTGTTTISAGTLQVGSGTSGALGGNIVDNAALVFSRSNALTYSGAVSGSGTLTKSGAGTLTLTGDSSGFAGTTTINAGTLQIGNAGGAGALGSNIVDNSALIFNRSGTLTYSATISGTGTLAKSGSGTLALTGDSSGFTGTTTVNAGTLQIGNGGSSGALGGNIVDNSALIFSRSGTLTYSATISGTGAMTKSGSGTLTLTGDSSGFTGTTTVNAGTLQIGGASTTGTLGGSIVNNAAFVFNRSDTLAYAGPISGNGTVTKSGGGMLTLTGDSSGFTGTTTVSAGTLQIGGGSGVGALGGSIVDNAALVFNRSNTLAYSGAISGIGTVTQNGNGTVVLSGANIYNGGTTINAGTLAFGNNNVLGSGPVTVNAGTLDLVTYTGTAAGVSLLGGSITGSNGNLLSTAGTFDLHYGTVAANLGGAGSLSKTTIGTVTLSGKNTYTGGTTVSAGTLRCGADNAIPAYALTISGGVLDLAGHSNTISALTVADGSVLGGNLIVTAGPLAVQNGTISANLAGTGLALGKTTAGTVILSGNNIYDGGTSVSGGLLSFGNLSSVPTGGALTVGAGGYLGAGFSATKTNFLDRFNKSSSTGVVGLEAHPTGPIDLTGFPDAVRLGSRTAVTLDSGNQITPSVNTYRLGGGGGTMTINYSLPDGSGARAVEIGTSGSLPAGIVVFGAANGYTGGTTVNAGTLRCGVDNAIPAYPLTVNGGTLDMAGHTTTVGAFTLAGGSVVSGTLLTTAPAFTVQSGAISAILAGTTSGLNKTGAGTLVLSGSNSYAGNTAITAGTLVAANKNAVPGYNSNKVTVSNAGSAFGVTIDGAHWTETDANNLPSTVNYGVGTNVALNVDSANTYTFTGPIAWAQGLTKTGAGTLVFSGSNSYAGNTAVTAGTLVAAKKNAVPGYNSNKVTVSNAGSAFGVTIDGVNWTEADVNNLPNTVNYGAETNVALNVDSANAYTFTGPIAWAQGLTKTGAGTLTLSGANTYTGGTRVDNGTVTFANALALPAGSNVTTTATGVVVFSSGFTGAIASGSYALADWPGGASFSLAAGGTDSMSGSLSAAPRAVPEPGTLVMLVPAILWLAWRGRRRATAGRGRSRRPVV